ncbi:DNA (cytosine-5)-methyltransferase CMT3 [Monoraphidium neglectum]|uniref:DNA (cytosine-5-)-methyltransferase n=1 Tax=Monoraphidium neglectum TaxID=145388 RepID=A0A0D2MFR1_9CHLO|nr:DNA (cytosine-5)-methyltransferase CMT3 [Monoraphidium neglectum]KIY93940.1 DNA (cytosine-5)-methyltransferase CMT3 [Monoraphidium neglectum]|eukprot:XP_013892960.1 DNA (cytosine-5)-methyltransferase CMT3 [Monoraphidium neglectum]
MRRRPPAGTPALAERAAAADRFMGPARRRLERAMRRAYREGGEEALGRLVRCNKDGSKKDFAGETWRKHLDSEGGRLTDPVLREAKEVARRLDGQSVFTWIGQVLQAELADSEADDSRGALRDHRPLLCNADDFLRMVAVPRERGANFRSVDGVVTHPDGTCCSGSWHAPKKVHRGAKLEDGLCPGGGCVHKPGDDAGAPDGGGDDDEDADEDGGGGGKGGGRGRGKAAASGSKGGGAAGSAASKAGAKSGPKTHERVDNYGSEDKGAWRGTAMDGCDAKTVWLPTGDLACPRWCITYKKGKSNGRHGCFGRIWHDSVQTTVVGRAEPHNLQLLHPEQDRVLTVRENARCQGFPDYYVLVGLEEGGGHGVSTSSLQQRYLQMGNAVAPPVAAALGRCLLLAAAGAAPAGAAVVAVADEDYEAVVASCSAKGIGAFVDDYGPPEVRS